MALLAITIHGGIRLAEVGIALDAVAGAALAVAAGAPLARRPGLLVAGLLLAAGSVLLVVAVHWGHFS